MSRIVTALIVFVLLSQHIFSQEEGVHVVRYKIVGNDTLPYLKISGIEVLDFKMFKTKKQARRNTRLIGNVKKVYPWAKLAGQKLREYEQVLSEVKKERQKREIMKQVEKEIHDQYGNELKKLTISQGKILIKLIDRETQNTSFALVKDFRGGFAAFFYQSFARLFDYNLKTKYDPLGEDRNIETIVRMIENGVL